VDYLELGSRDMDGRIEKPGNSSIIVIDDFLQDTKALRSISKSPFWRDPAYYWHLMTGLDNGIGSYIVSRIVEQQDLLNAWPFEKALGFEYWPTVLNDDDDILEVGEDGDIYSLDLHVDKDENLARATGEYVYPLFGALLYFLDSEIKGGLLKIWIDDHTYKMIEPKDNRLIVFDSSKPHGVTAVQKGLRRSIAINFWDHQPHLEEL
jgi:hypothetical protein